jgi:hypothetical protein
MMDRQGEDQSDTHGAPSATRSETIVEIARRKGGIRTMTALRQSQKDQLKGMMRELKRLQKQLRVIHDKTGYEDLEHGVLALQIAEHTVEETLGHTGLGGEIRHKPNAKARRQATQWYKIVKGLRSRGGKFLKTHPSEDLETALKALDIAEGSLEEVAEHYE